MKNIKNNFAPLIFTFTILFIWQIMCSLGKIPKYLLPSPLDIINAFIEDFDILLQHSKTTLTEAFLGLFFAIIISFIVAFLMDRFEFLKKCFYPLIILTQTIPTVAIAPLLVLWLGYDMLPKVVLVIITCFFPITIGLLNGFSSIDTDVLNLMNSMGANPNQIFIHIKFPSSLGHFFSALKISASYCVVGAVISEWLGGYSGLGVYMIRVKKSYNFDKMFAVILLISAISLVLMKIVDLLQKKIMKKW